MHRGASPLELPDTLSREPLRRLAPFAGLASLRSLAAFVGKTDVRYWDVPSHARAGTDSRHLRKSTGYGDSATARLLRSTRREIAYLLRRR